LAARRVGKGTASESSLFLIGEGNLLWQGKLLAALCVQKILSLRSVFSSSIRNMPFGFGG
jgi:hypothetical protein